jgi:hypothetical protein
LHLKFGEVPFMKREALISVPMFARAQKKYGRRRLSPTAPDTTGHVTGEGWWGGRSLDFNAWAGRWFHCVANWIFQRRNGNIPEPAPFKLLILRWVSWEPGRVTGLTGKQRWKR